MTTERLALKLLSRLRSGSMQRSDPVCVISTISQQHLWPMHHLLQPFRPVAKGRSVGPDRGLHLLPLHSGRSRHGAPDRSTQHMPLRTRRSSTRGTPRALFGNIGLMERHREVLKKPPAVPRSRHSARLHSSGLCDQYISGPGAFDRGRDRQAPRRPRSSGSST